MTAAHEPWPTAVRWYERFRKAVTAVLALAAVPGVLGVLEAIGVHFSAGLWATVLGIAGVVVGGGTVAAVPNTPSLDDARKAAELHGLIPPADDEGGPPPAAPRVWQP